MIVHLNGWPGVGKKTIGAILAQRLGARFIHNHTLHDVAIACAGIGDPERWPLYEKVRAAAYTALAERPTGEHFVMTNALCTHAPREIEAWRHVVNLAMRRGVPLIPVVLEADPAENLRRVQTAERQGAKLSDPTVLQSLFHEDSIQKPAVPELLVLDVTSLSPEEAAARIEAHLAGLSPLPAGPTLLNIS
jgi:gluconate kinase